MFDLTESIRDILQSIVLEIYNKLNSINTGQIYSSLDTIEDCDEAILFYKKSKDTVNTGEKYLRLYGLFQALFVQQHACQHLIEALELDIEILNNEQLKRIRDVRNKSTGHPSKKGIGKNKYSYNFISRITVTKNKFESLMDSENNFDYEEINILDCISNQNQILTEILQKVIKILKLRVKTFMKEYSKMPLKKAFPQTMNYHLNSISVFFSEIQNSKPRTPGEAHFAVLVRSLEELKNIIDKKGYEIDTIEGIEKYLNDLEIPLIYLKNQLNSRTWINASPKVLQKMKIYYFYVKHQIKELIEMIEEFDNSFKSKL